MQKQCAAVLFSLLLLISGALAVYGECAEAANHLDFAPEHEASLIHCPEVFLISNSQAASTIKSHSRNLSKSIPSVHPNLDNVFFVSWFKDNPFREPFSRQDIFRLEQVYRL